MATLPAGEVPNSTSATSPAGEVPNSTNATSPAGEVPNSTNATTPAGEQQNKLMAFAAAAPQAPAATLGGAALGLYASRATYQKLLPGVKALLDQLAKLADAGQLAEVDECLRHMLEDWQLLSLAELDQHRRP